MITLNSFQDNAEIEVDPEDIVVVREFSEEVRQVFLQVTAPEDVDGKYLQVGQNFDQIEDACENDKPEIVFIRIKGAGDFSLLLNTRYIGSVIDQQALEQVHLKAPILFSGQGSEPVRALRTKKPTMLDLVSQTHKAKGIPLDFTAE